MKHIRAITIVIEHEEKIYHEAMAELDRIEFYNRVGAAQNDKENLMREATKQKEDAEAVLITMKARLKQYCE